LSAPLVSIGLFVYNGADYLAAAIDSLLAQDYPSLELVISDNGSTDSTEAIARNYTERDARVRYVRSPDNRGTLWNFCNVFDLSTGPYFMWAGHHDLWDARFVSSCIAELEASPESVLAYTQTRYVDAQGAPMREGEPAIDTRGLTAGQRLARILEDYPICSVYGVIRRAALAQLRNQHGIGQRYPVNYPVPDVPLVAELARLGAFALVPRPYYFNRVFPGRGWTVESKVKQLRPPTGGDPRFAYWALVRTLVAIARDTPMSASERLAFASVLMKRWVAPHRNRLLYELDVLRLVSRLKRFARRATPQRT
jgi:glycosyltransferase involved in cell wall biosynthesis